MDDGASLDIDLTADVSSYTARGYHNYTVYFDVPMLDGGDGSAYCKVLYITVQTGGQITLTWGN